MQLPKIIILNIYPPSSNETEKLKKYGFKWIVADGRRLPFKDKSIDIAFSNSVIEHLGNIKSQSDFAKEIMRVSKNFWVQTPDKSFPVEPHLITPFVHWLPLKLQKILLRNFTIWGIVTRPSKEDVNTFLDEVRLLTYKEFKSLFPVASIIRERFAGLSKSLIAFYREK